MFILLVQVNICNPLIKFTESICTMSYETVIQFVINSGLFIVHFSTYNNRRTNKLCDPLETSVTFHKYTMHIKALSHKEESIHDPEMAQLFWAKTHEKTLRKCGILKFFLKNMDPVSSRLK